MHSVGVALSERVLEHQMVEEGPCSHQVGQMSNTQPHTGNLDMLSGCIVGVGGKKVWISKVFVRWWLVKCAREVW